MANELEHVPKLEERSRSELVRMALQRYFRDRLWEALTHGEGIRLRS
jgi:metal-responsive CopG/Arc/MetJ family transcriptional regulator